MALSQFEIIKSLGEALSWFERELAWGVPAVEISHLTGRIGELYAAMITYGQMATEPNQRGYDVVSAAGERISVKTVTSEIPVAFNENTFDLVDRVMVLKLNAKELAIEILMDAPATQAKEAMRTWGGRLVLPIKSPAQADTLPRTDLLITKQAMAGDIEIRQYENGTVEVVQNARLITPALPILRTIAAGMGIDHFNSTGTPKNTRHLGDQIIRELLARKQEASATDE
ncbi:DUF6998 domain-containing protein [Rhizobium grahamii]|uniref:DUF6998 domain-containing protein n=1 Tax=Rhizobium grahamii CCGE 502 TaxID=990285 RepID=S3HKL7_9HYPH|nr:hypothetical protein [Rhizobium grahamii]EPE98600.1 hypothetical protein RGCCGE502_09245 [Rhizobium grahamii CCGE 502]